LNIGFAELTITIFWPPRFDGVFKLIQAFARFQIFRKHSVPNNRTEGSK
jgi:hypothetical protein